MYLAEISDSSQLQLFDSLLTCALTEILIFEICTNFRNISLML